MKAEFVLMVLCFLLASLAVLGRPADETDVEDKNEDHDAPPNPDWPWNKRTATDLDKGRPADETDVEDKNEDHGRKTHGRKSSRRNRSAQDAPPNPDWPWNKRTATDLDKGRPADETDVEDKNEDHVKVLEDPRWDAPPNPDWPWNKRTATDLDKGRPADETDVEDKNEDHVKVLEDPRWGNSFVCTVQILTERRSSLMGGKTHGRKSTRRNRSAQDWPWNKRTAKDLDKGMITDSDAEFEGRKIGRRRYEAHILEGLLFMKRPD
ncbi:hypothetical protein ACROYT_G017694 [Oculina patagonica]